MSTPDFLTLVRRQVQYNQWANARILAVCKEAGDKACNTTFLSSFPSIHQTLMHIRDAEWIWSMRLTGSTFTALPFAPLPECNPFDELLHTSQLLCNDAATRNEEELFEMVPYKNIKGTLFSHSRFDMFMHCTNHSSYHRGQVVTLLRMTGATTIPSTDLIEFLKL